MPTKIRLSLLSLALMITVPLAPQALASKSITLASSGQEIASGSAMIVDLQSNKVLYSSHPDLVRPIASITKLMTAMVVLDAHLPLDEMLSVDISHTSEMKGIYSRVRLNSKISRKDMLLLALMSVDNVSTARDLTKMLIASKQYPLIGQLSTTKEDMATFSNPPYTLPFRNTNHLVYRNNWNIQLTKTGFTNNAGHCLVMRTVINQRPVSLVVLDAFGKYTHFADANRLRSFLETGKITAVPSSALSYKKQKAAQMASNATAGNAQED